MPPTRHLVRRLLPLLLLGLVGAVLVGPAGSTRSAAAEEKPTFLGFASLDRPDLFAVESAAGQAPAFWQLYWTLEQEFPPSWWDSAIDDLDQLGTSIYAEITTDDLAALNSGARDAALDNIVAHVRSWINGRSGRYLLVSPLPESNLPQHPWGGDPAGYRAGYNRIRDAFRDAGLGPDKVRFVFSVNGPGYSFGDYGEFYPGDDVVDILAFSRINRNNPWYDYEETFGRWIRQMQQQVSYTKPIMSAQTGSVVETGDRDAWLEDMFVNLAAHEQVIGAVYFSREKNEGGKDNDYRVVVDDWVDPVFADLYGSLWSGPSEISWIFDGRMDAWVAERESSLTFVDALDSPFYDEILWMADQGITSGCDSSGALFCPDSPVTRAQMATFLIRALADPPSSFNYFIDDDGSVHEPNINGLAAAEITFGCDDGMFCPDDPVTRAQMASFLVRALNLPANADDRFADDDGSVHEASINSLAASGITLGCGGTSFCPDNLVTREQMAAFLYRALGS